MEKLGEKRAVAAISIATMIICTVGVFIDISVITVAPIALAIGESNGGYGCPFGACIGLTSTIVSVVIFLI